MSLFNLFRRQGSAPVARERGDLPARDIDI